VEYERLFTKLDALKSATCIGEADENAYKAAALARGSVSWVIPFLEDFNAKKNELAKTARAKKRQGR
jgi:hypothetical protein